MHIGVCKSRKPSSDLSKCTKLQSPGDSILDYIDVDYKNVIACPKKADVVRERDEDKGGRAEIYLSIQVFIHS
jgi:hypothetical protein